MSSTRILAVYDVSTVLNDGVIRARPEPIEGHITLSTPEVALERSAWLRDQEVHFFREDNAELRQYLGELKASADAIAAEQAQTRQELETNLGEIHRLQGLKFEVR